MRACADAGVRRLCALRADWLPRGVGAIMPSTSVSAPPRTPLSLHSWVSVPCAGALPLVGSDASAGVLVAALAGRTRAYRQRASNEPPQQAVSCDVAAPRCCPEAASVEESRRARRATGWRLEVRCAVS